MAEHRPEGEVENRISETRVRLYGDTAVLTGIYAVVYESNDRNIVRENRYTDTYIKRGRRWYLAASHFSLRRER